MAQFGSVLLERILWMMKRQQKGAAVERMRILEKAEVVSGTARVSGALLKKENGLQKRKKKNK